MHACAKWGNWWLHPGTREASWEGKLLNRDLRVRARENESKKSRSGGEGTRDFQLK
jgi:hypothetical protein